MKTVRMRPLQPVSHVLFAELPLIDEYTIRLGKFAMQPAAQTEK
jgi:hypothetical protein